MPYHRTLGGIIPLCLRKGHLIEFAAGRIGVMSAIGPKLRHAACAKFWHLMFAPLAGRTTPAPTRTYYA